MYLYLNLVNFTSTYTNNLNNLFLNASWQLCIKREVTIDVFYINYYGMNKSSGYYMQNRIVTISNEYFTKYGSCL